MQILDDMEELIIEDSSYDKKTDGNDSSFTDLDGDESTNDENESDSDEAIKEEPENKDEDDSLTDEDADDSDGEESDNEGNEESSNVTYLNMLIEKGAIGSLTEEFLSEFKSLGFDEQTERLLEVHDNSIKENAINMFNEYIADKPLKLRIIEENYQKGMDADSAIKSALEAPSLYNPSFETERDEKLEHDIIIEKYLKLVGGDTSKAEILFNVDKEKGISKDIAIEISKEKHDAWLKSQEDYLKQLDDNTKAHEKAFNDEKISYSEFLKNTDELLPNIKLTKEDKVKIYNSRYQGIQTSDGVVTSLNSKIAKNPEKAAAIMSYFFDVMNLLEEPKNIDKLFKIGKTIQANSIIDKWKKSSVGITNKRITKTSTDKKSLSDFSFDKTN